MEDLRLNDKREKTTLSDKQRLKNEKALWKKKMRDKGVDPKKALSGNKDLKSLQV